MYRPGFGECAALDLAIGKFEKSSLDGVRPGVSPIWIPIKFLVSLIEVSDLSVSLHDSCGFPRKGFVELLTNNNSLNKGECRVGLLDQQSRCVDICMIFTKEDSLDAASPKITLGNPRRDVAE